MNHSPNESLEPIVYRRNLDLPLDWPAGANRVFDGAKEWARANEAIYARLPESLESLIEAGFPVNTEHSESKRTVLHTAAMFGDAAMVRMLLKHGATIDKPDAYGITPLHSAAWKNNAGTIKVLCEARATIDARDDDDATPLHTAALRLAPKAVQVLIDAGADVNASTGGRTPLFFVVMYENDTRWDSAYRDHGGMRAEVRVMRALLAAGAEPSEAVLAEAVASNHTLAMRALVRAGADPTTVEAGPHEDARLALEELIVKHVQSQARVLNDAVKPVAVRKRSRL
ncbi:ankyrin repeat domain-containing protein [Burkholderia gladioli]|uniref:ankyrin repeat domain-containing protein n=1 Tax=Burkholderia gladioli TaxID=28095 RepID=UPI00163F12CC|nr:ankyrin repeat domain-containing protein [Burkholderia gladioli]